MNIYIYWMWTCKCIDIKCVYIYTIWYIYIFKQLDYNTYIYIYIIETWILHILLLYICMIYTCINIYIYIHTENTYYCMYRSQNETDSAEFLSTDPSARRSAESYTTERFAFRTLLDANMPSSEENIWKHCTFQRLFWRLFRYHL